MKRIAAIVLVLFFAAGALSADDDYLFVIGAVEGSNLYMSYLALGLLGDAYENGVYDEATAQSISKEIEGLTKNIRATINSLVEKGRVAGDDRVLILEMVAAQDMLEKQAGELGKYIDDPKAANDFQYYRQQAWDKIAKILGIGSR